MSKREKKKKIISGVMSSATLIGGVTAGIIYASKTEEEKKVKETEAEKKETEKEKTKTQSSIKPKQSKSNTYIKQQFTIYLDKNRKKVKISKIDLSDENIKEIVQIGFYQNGEGEVQTIKMPKTIEKVPNKLPPEITSTKDMFAVAESFNQDISQWDTSNVKDMNNMFVGALLFNQDLSGWNVSNVIKHEGFATNSKINNSTISYLPRFKS